MRYAFGTTTIASERLAKLAQIFNPQSREFIAQHAKLPLVSAIDLGCGPGYTTKMLSFAVNAKEVYGFDNSEDFLVEASDMFTDCAFVMHDVTRIPFPVRGDLMYARFVLAHLQYPARQVNTWTDELNSGGTLCIEETEDIKTDIEVFNRYLEINRKLVASQGANLFPGKQLARGVYTGEVLTNEAVELPVSNCDAAAMFYPNTVSIWENNEENREISARLKEIMDSGDERKGIVWKMRRIAIRKKEHYPYLEMFI